MRYEIVVCPDCGADVYAYAWATVAPDLEGTLAHHSATTCPGPEDGE